MPVVTMENRHLARFWIEAAIQRASEESDEKLLEILNAIAGGPEPIVRIDDPEIPGDVRFEIRGRRYQTH